VEKREVSVGELEGIISTEVSRRIRSI